MQEIKLVRNEDIDSAIIAVPPGHRHLRLAVTLKDGTAFILQEAAVAAMVRAYTTVKTHPVKRAVMLVSVKPEGLKKGYAADQLVEVKTADGEVEEEMGRLMD